MNREQDIRETARQLGLAPDEADRVVTDIMAGDAALADADKLQWSPQAARRLRDRLTGEMTDATRRPRRHAWRRVGLTALAAAAVFVLLLRVHQPPPSAEPPAAVEPSVLADEPDSQVEVWDLALWEEPEADYDLDDVALTGVLMMLQEEDSDSAPPDLGRAGSANRPRRAI